ncbi:MAG: hypothetical protein GEV10_04960 [Streptosporangiales bacterium]|nr:hypothetical protein [Streptosporangiales bacterium]
MPTITDVRHEITKALDNAPVSKPLYAVAGVGDLAVEKLRHVEQRFRALGLERRFAEFGDEARALPTKAQHVRTDVQTRVRDLPTTVVDAAITASDRAAEVYDGLSVRGKKLVDAFGGQAAATVTESGARKTTAPKAAASRTGTKTSSAAKNGKATKSTTKKASPKKS